MVHKMLLQSYSQNNSVNHVLDEGRFLRGCFLYLKVTFYLKELSNSII